MFHDTLTGKGENVENTINPSGFNIYLYTNQQWLLKYPREFIEDFFFFFLNDLARQLISKVRPLDEFIFIRTPRWWGMCPKKSQQIFS